MAFVGLCRSDLALLVAVSAKHGLKLARARLFQGEVLELLGLEAGVCLRSCGDIVRPLPALSVAHLRVAVLVVILTVNSDVTVGGLPCLAYRRRGSFVGHLAHVDACLLACSGAVLGADWRQILAASVHVGILKSFLPNRPFVHPRHVVDGAV